MSVVLAGRVGAAGGVDGSETISNPTVSDCARARRSFDQARFFFSVRRHSGERFSHPLDVAPRLAGMLRPK